MDDQDNGNGSPPPGSPKPESPQRRIAGYASIVLTIGAAVAGILSISHSLNAKTAAIAVTIVVGITSFSTYFIERRNR